MYYGEHIEAETKFAPMYPIKNKQVLVRITVWNWTKHVNKRWLNLANAMLYAKQIYFKSPRQLKRNVRDLPPIVYRMRPRQNDHHFPDDILKYIFLNENVLIFSIKMSLKCVPRGRVNNFLALVQIMICTDQATSHYLSEWWLDESRISASLGLNELNAFPFKRFY